MIAQPQYGFAPTMPMMPSMSDMPPGMMGQNMPQMNFKEGGIASLPKMAERVREAGRGEDRILAHINPEEAGILKLLGGSGRINPSTGIPEFGFLKKIIPKPIYRLGSKIGKELERGVEKVAKELGPVGQIAAAYFGGPIGAALYAGLAPEGSSFDVKRAALAGGLTYGANALSGAENPLAPKYDWSGTFGGEAAAAAPIDAAATQTAAEAAAGTPSVVESVSSAAAPASSDIGSIADVGEIPGVTSFSGAVPPPPPTFMESATNYVQNIPSRISEGIQSLPETISELPGKAVQFAKDLPSDALNYALNNKVNTAFIGSQVYSAMEAKKELDNQKEEAERILAAQEKHTQEEIAFAQDVLRKYPVEYRRLTAEDIKSQNFAGGGLAGLNAFKAGGGPRFLKGGGDGMSDDIPAMIGKQQKAALSDGEFVVPADVVSHLGNGSSRAGAKKLYSMMDNIRQARTGKKRQAPEVKPDRYMPA
jgi:hypothetical protein